MEQNAKIYVAGHNGLVGSAIVRKLQEKGYTNIITRSSKELDLTNQADTLAFFEAEKPDYVFLAAAKVGGIMANKTYPAEFIYNNLMISANIINSAYRSGVKKLLNLASSCIYPKEAAQPMAEEELLSGELEKTSEAYAIAKISAIKLCTYYNQQYGTDFMTVMPPNQYGIGDNFSMETAHFLPMIIRRFHLAKLLFNRNFVQIAADIRHCPLGWGIDEKINFDDSKSIEQALAEVGAYKDRVVMWGDGLVYRELMNSDDLADVCVYLMNNKTAKDIGEFINLGDGTDIQLRDLFELVKTVIGFEGKIEYDISKPGGVRRKILNAKRIQSLGWQPKTNLEQGIRNLYAWYLETVN